ncbi:hypothetical protein B4110_3683 [Parageobacillus toebii]|uniref:Uncharacterized protein n=1 Tax=Parageobacillus toebii TaxID=153151 RepID=A0A150N3Z7_9BACL|nr:hypothetical protein B4110_3683 [Parageobacillus toebii]
MQPIQRIGFIRTVNRLVRCIRVKDTEREAFFLVDLHQARRKDLMDIGLIQPVQMASNGIVVEPRRIQSWPDQLGQVDVMRPPFQMNEGLPAAQDIQEKQPDHITGSGLALRIHRNQPVNQLREAKIFENGTYYIQIGTFINRPNSNVHDGKTPLHSLCVKDLFDTGMKKSSRFWSRGCEM